MRHNPAQDDIFLGAFSRRLRVSDDIAAAAMEQAVVAPGRAIGQVALLYQHSADATHRQVAQATASGRSAANHEDICTKSLHKAFQVERTSREVRQSVFGDERSN
jgi:hypothetical protein